MASPRDEKTIPATEFKQKCLALLDQVARTRAGLIVTKHGKPVARVVPIATKDRDSMIGSVTLLSERPEEYYSTDEVWSVDLP